MATNKKTTSNSGRKRQTSTDTKKINNTVKFAFIDENKKYEIKRATNGSACYDLAIVNFPERDNMIDLISNQSKIYGTNVAVEIPENHVGMLFVRSSLSKDYGITLLNNVGIIDSDYRGEILAILKNVSGRRQTIMNNAKKYHLQLMIVPIPSMDLEITEYDKLSKTERGNGGCGSTDK